MYAPGAVIDADVTVRVNGVVREHVSMTWAGDTTGGLPDQVVSAGTGMRSRTGTIVWAQQDAVGGRASSSVASVFGLAATRGGRGRHRRDGRYWHWPVHVPSVHGPPGPDHGLPHRRLPR